MGNRHLELGSNFSAMATKVNNIDEVRHFYKKVCLDTAGVDHNILAYRYTASGKTMFGVCDDGEYGGGMAILRLMEQKDLNNEAIVVNRHYGGTKLGGQRFKIIQNVAHSASVNLEESLRK